MVGSSFSATNNLVCFESFRIHRIFHIDACGGSEAEIRPINDLRVVVSPSSIAGKSSGDWSDNFECLTGEIKPHDSEDL